MATTPVRLEKFIPLLKKWGPLFIVIGIIGIVSANLITKVVPSWPIKGSGNWVTVKRSTCSPTWNNDRGWCPIVKVNKGTYRVIPRYKTWELFQSDNTFVLMPPHGINIYANWKQHEEFIEEFHQSGQKQGSNNYGALLVRIGDADLIEALTSSRSPRIFSVTEDGTEIAVTVNLVALEMPYKFNRGLIPVELQRQE
ncbi:MAG: hypothetical protein ACSLEX_03365 [Minisyncoccota bacterium]